MNVKNFHGKSVIDSREVAEMVEKNHKDLLRDIRGYIKIMEKVNERNFALVGTGLNFQPIDFFMESSYKDNKGETRPCYLITKKGCDMIANKLTGEKGVLFTAAYVTAFEDMRKALETPKRVILPRGVSFGSVVDFMRLTKRTMLDMGCTPADVGVMIKETCEAVNFPVPPSLIKQIPGQTSLFDYPALSG